MAYIKADNQKEQKYFDFLEDLRQWGDTDMFGATPYLQQAFDLDRGRARDVLCKWIELHDDPKRCSDKPFTDTKTKAKMVTVIEVTESER